MESQPTSPAPAPSPISGTILVGIADVFWVISVLSSVLITTTLLLFLFFIGRIRRSVHPRWFLKYATKICYVLVPISITYIIGLMHNAQSPPVWYPIWAGALIYAYGGVVTMTVFDVRENDDTVRFVLRTLPLVFWTLWLGVLVSSNIHASLVWVGGLVLFLVLAAINARQTLQAHYKASKSKGLPRVIEPIVSYMEEGRHIVPNEDEANPRFMRGYRYVVWGNPTLQRDNNNNKFTFVTTEDIWRWVTTIEEEEEILQSHTFTQEQEQTAFHPVTILEEQETSSSELRLKFTGTSASKERLRDLCLSYAFFMLLLRRFAGFPLHESSKRSTKRFIMEGLLCSQDPPRFDLERVFRIVEVELDFLFDFFYTKSHVCSSYRFRDVLQHLAQIGLLWFFGTIGVELIEQSPDHHLQNLSIHLFGHRFEVGVTRTVVMLFVLLEFWKFIMANYSNRKMVWLLCTSLMEVASSSKCARVTQKRIVWIWTVKYYLSRLTIAFLFFKPWQRKLGQYSFLTSYGRVPLLARKSFSPLAKLVALPRFGQSGEFSVPLSKQVKQAIVSSLLQNQLHLSRGTTTSSRYHLTDLDHHPEEIDTNVILVWHIATSFCECLNPPPNPNDHNHDQFLVATHLSKYCAYLLTFSPELLPGHPYSTERLFDNAVEQARRLNMRRMTIVQIYQYLITRNDNNIIVVKGARLAHALNERVMNNPDLGWKVLAEFWAELLLYLAPSDNVMVHADYLAKGGEFITHLWALLTHAGVVTRN